MHQPDEQHSAHIDQKKHLPEPAPRQFSFCVGNYHFLVPQGLFCEFVVAPEITPLPNTPSHVLGLYNHRGAIVSAFSLAPALEIVQLSNNFLLIDHPDRGAALKVDGFPSLVTIDEDSKTGEKPTNDLLAICVTECHQINGIIYYALSPEKLLLALSSPET